jgi:hypothetical protein
MDQEGFSLENDQVQSEGELALAAACYAIPSEQRDFNNDHSFVPLPKLFPWEQNWWKPTPENRIKELVKAGALIAAEIDRLQAQ